MSNYVNLKDPDRANSGPFLFGDASQFSGSYHDDRLVS